MVAAIQLGRLDLVSAILAGLGLILAVGGVFGYLHFKYIAEYEARTIAERIAREVAVTYMNDGGQERVKTPVGSRVDVKSLDFSIDTK